jgi:hypothetical protein
LEASTFPPWHLYQRRMTLPRYAFLWGSKDLSVVKLQEALGKLVMNSAVSGEQETVNTRCVPVHVQPHDHPMTPILRGVGIKTCIPSQAAPCKTVAPSDVAIEAALPNEMALRPTAQPERALADVTLLDRSKANTVSLSSGNKPVAVIKLASTKRKSGDPTHAVVSPASKPITGVDTSSPVKHDTQKPIVGKTSSPFSLTLDATPAALSVNPVSTKCESKNRFSAASPESEAISGTNVSLAKVETGGSNVQGKSRPAALSSIKSKPLLGSSPSPTNCEAKKTSVQEPGTSSQDAKLVATQSPPAQEKTSKPRIRATSQSNTSGNSVPTIRPPSVKGEITSSRVSGKPQSPEGKPIMTAQPSSPTKRKKAKTLSQGGVATTTPPYSTKCQTNKPNRQGISELATPSPEAPFPNKCETKECSFQRNSPPVTPPSNAASPSTKCEIVEPSLQEKRQPVTISTENKLQTTKCEAVESTSGSKLEPTASFSQSLLDAGAMSVSPVVVPAILTKLSPMERGSVDCPLLAQSSEAEAVIRAKLETTEISQEKSPFDSSSPEAEPVVVTKPASPWQHGEKGFIITSVSLETELGVKHSPNQIEGPILEEKRNPPPLKDKFDAVSDSLSHTMLKAKDVKLSTSVPKPESPHTQSETEKPTIQEKSKPSTPSTEAHCVTAPPANGGIEPVTVALENKPFSTPTPIPVNENNSIENIQTPIPAMEDKLVSSRKAQIYETKEGAFNEKSTRLSERKDTTTPPPFAKPETHSSGVDLQVLPHLSGSAFSESSTVLLREGSLPHVSNAHDPSITLLRHEQSGSLSVPLTISNMSDEILKNGSDSYANIFEEVKEALQNIERCFQLFESLGLRNTDEDPLSSASSSACQVLA